jgi:Mg2+ and Co2+ transporter CorA
MLLNTTQMNTVLNVLTTFIEKRDTFTIDNVLRVIKDQGDQFNGFYDDNGDSIVDELIDDITEAVETVISSLYHEISTCYKKVYIFEENKKFKEDD